MTNEEVEQAVKKSALPIGGKEKLPLLSRDEIFIRRDASGTVEPIIAPVPLLSRSIKITPLTIGSITPYEKEGLLDMPAIEWPIEAKVRLVREHVRNPDLSDLTVEKATETLDLWTLDQLVTSVAAYSGPLRKRGKERHEEVKM